MGTSPLKFFPVARADSKLEDSTVANQFPAASKDTGVGEGNTELILPQISVCIKMDDVYIGEFFCHGTKGAQCYQMLAAQHERAFV